MKKKIDYRHFICVGITLVCLAFSVFKFKYAPLRIWESLIDIFNSFKFYLNELFGFNFAFEPTVNDFTKQPFIMPFNLPNTWEEFKALWRGYWQLYITKSNIQAYFTAVGDFLYYFARYLIVFLPFILVLILLFQREIPKNNDYNKDSKPLALYKRFERKVLRPIKTWLRGFFAFVAETSVYYKLWLLIWAWNFNFFSIIIEFFAYYLYFVASFDLISLYIQVLKLLMDLSAMLYFIPTIGWIVLALVIIDRVRRNIALNTLRHFEMRNRGFINSLPITTLICGTMGTGKTTMLSDMLLSLEAIFRDKAQELIFDNDMRFSNFPWINFENDIGKAYDEHKIFNLATVRSYVDDKLANFNKNPCKENLWDYDFEYYGVTFDDKLKVVELFDVLQSYAQLYFVYLSDVLVLTNYSVRTDFLYMTEDNFPLWDTDFFARSSAALDVTSRHSKILDFDALRLKRTAVKDNPLANSYDFGILGITEYGKERKNMLELKEIKKKDAETNQRNDGFIDGTKMRRHSGTIDYYPFVKEIGDEQRPESVGADARDTFKIVHIRNKSDVKLAMPLFAIGELIHDFVISRFKNYYYQYRFARGDNTLFMYLLKKLASSLHNYYLGIYNLYGYTELTCETEMGTLSGDVEKHSYYLANKKIYSKRFSTDAFSDYFAKKTMRSEFGLNDLEEYSSERATFDELKRQNSYFINELINNDDIINKK